MPAGMGVVEIIEGVRIALREIFEDYGKWVDRIVTYDSHKREKEEDDLSKSTTR